MLIDGVFYSAEFDFNDDSVSYKDAAGTTLIKFTNDLCIEDEDGNHEGRLTHLNGGWCFEGNGVRLDLHVPANPITWQSIERAELALFTYFIANGKKFP